MLLAILIFALIGLGISYYAYTIEKRIKQNPAYKPACDLSDRISCSKPMKSAYTNVFYFSNATIGLLFYAAIIIFALLGATKLVLLTAIAGCIGSCILGYILYFKIKALCLLCTVLYIINALILLLAYNFIR